MKILNEMKHNYEINIFPNYLHIVNYKTIKEISFSLINIELFDNSINIIGKDLLIKKMNEKEMIITGNIKGIDFIER